MVTARIGAPRVELKACLRDGGLGVMNFLNEIVLDYPDAISFAPGRPLESLFDVELHVNGIARSVGESARREALTEKQAWQRLGQYNRTNGIITDVIAQHLLVDEGIHVASSGVMVTVGAQEAMAVLLTGLFDAARDILLVSDPTYIGITGLARILGIRVVPIAAGDEGLDADAVDEAIVRYSREGRVRALYDIPDFNNPLGTSLPARQRLRLLEVCARHGILIIEDNPYGMFTYEGERPRTLKALDTDAVVIYIGSFAKTLFPALRVGYLIADQKVAGSEDSLAKALSAVKSLITVNTSTLCQAIVADALSATGASLEPMVAPKRAAVKRNRDTLLACLEHQFTDMRPLIDWNTPRGGFFLVISLPFDFGVHELTTCAAEYGVIVCPMEYFCVASGGRRNQVRLSFSYLRPDAITSGIERFAAFVRERAPALQARAM